MRHSLEAVKRIMGGTVQAAVRAADALQPDYDSTGCHCHPPGMFNGHRALSGARWHGTRDADVLCGHFACELVSIIGLRFKYPSDRCYYRYELRKFLESRWLFTVSK